MSKNKTKLLTQAVRQHLNISTTLAMSVVMASSSAVYSAVLPQINLPKQHVLPGPAAASRELLFIDSDVANPEQLLINLNPGIETIILQPDRDGLEQITAVINSRQNIEAIHIVAHGEAGQLHLGKLSLTTEELNNRASSLQSWFAHTNPASEKPDLLLYACNLAQDGKGTAFVEQLALLTGTDVAASNDITGAGGDWDLEVHLGTIHTLNAFRPENVAEYPYRLATFTVTKTADTDDGTCAADCSLREAIDAANGAVGPDIIAFGAGVTGTITLTLGGINSRIDISDDLTINGPGAGTLAISGNNTSRIFNASSSTLTIRDLTLRDGNATYGGAIQSTVDTLTIEDSVITQNNARSGGGGGIYQESGAVFIRRSEISNNSANESGGGILFKMLGSDTLTIEDSLITQNTAQDFGGGVAAYADDEGGTVTMISSTISENTAGYGGGIHFYTDDDGDLVVEDSTISGNQATSQGGGIWFYSDEGAINITNSTISGNSTDGSGGGIFIEYSEGTNIENSTVVFNTATDEGGGIMDDYNNAYLTLENSIVSDNTASFAPDISSDRSYVSYSLIGNTEGAYLYDSGGNILDTASGVSPTLANAGGTTAVHLLQVGSPAINSGASGTSLLSFDQRGIGFPRILQDRLDMGAVENIPGSVEPPPVEPPPVESVPVEPIPVMQHWALLLLSFLMPALALRYRRRLEDKKTGKG